MNDKFKSRPLIERLQTAAGAYIGSAAKMDQKGDSDAAGWFRQHAKDVSEAIALLKDREEVVEITSIRIHTEERLHDETVLQHAFVTAQAKGHGSQWFELIHAVVEGCIVDHAIHPSGIREAIERQAP